MSALIKTFHARQFAQIDGTSRVVRSVALPAGWTRARLGVLMALSGAASETLAMGLGFCAGTANILGDATTDHWVGFRSVGAWTYSAGNYVSGTIYGAKLIGTTFTNGGGSSGFDCSDIADKDHVAGFFMDLIKGSPNYGLEQVRPDTGPTVANTMTEAVFDGLMDIPVTLNAYKPAGYYYATTAVACNEATNGTLDAACVSWPGTNLRLVIDKISVSGFKM